MLMIFRFFFLSPDLLSSVLSLFYTLSLSLSLHAKRTTKTIPSLPCDIPQDTACQKKNETKRTRKRKKEKKTLRFHSAPHFGARVFREQLRFEVFKVRPRFRSVVVIVQPNLTQTGQPVIRKLGERRDELAGVECFGHRFAASMLAGERRF